MSKQDMQLLWEEPKQEDETAVPIASALLEEDGISEEASTEDEIKGIVREKLSQMTLEEKIGQLCQAAGGNTEDIGSQQKNAMTLEDRIRAGRIGSVIVMGNREESIRLQRIAVEESLMGIPLLFCQDVIHGKETVFPIPLAWACSFDPKLVEEAAATAASEASALGIMLGFSPMLDIARDPRWGRVAEGNGEDPYLCARMCEAHVRGFQGEDPRSTGSIRACLKHYIGYSAAEGGRDYNTCEISEHTLYNVYLPPFEAGVCAGAAAVMSSFNVMNGIPVSINQRMLKKLLREELGFSGIVISDYNAVLESVTHGAAEDEKDAAVKAMRASLDVEMVSGCYDRNLAEAVEEGLLTEAQIDACAGRVLELKYRLGLMEDPYRFFQAEESERIFTKQNRQVSHRLAAESLVLLKNDGILPLKGNPVIGLIGPFGESKDLLGTWQFSTKGEETITLREGLEQQGFTVLAAEGCRVEEAYPGSYEKAAEVAAQADVLVLALGEASDMSGEAASRQQIVIPKCQLKLAKALVKLQKPIILVLTNGRPLLLNWFEENVNAILETWFLGSEAGAVIAEAIRGVYNPSGKLSISFPSAQGQIPVYYNHLSTGRPLTEGAQDRFLSRYLDGVNEPLYSFGYGLSYTSFEIRDLKLSANRILAKETLTASVEVVNTGTCTGEEVVQLYIRDCQATIARPVKELKGFQRVELKPGESRQLTFEIGQEELSFYLDQSLIDPKTAPSTMKKIVQPGRFEVMVGNSSRDCDLCRTEFQVIEEAGL